nr:YlcG family protein [Enterobacter roggenkampii]
MKPEMIDLLRARLRRLSIYHRPGSVLVVYQIFRNYIRIESKQRWV